MSLILVANLLNNARQICTKEAILHHERRGPLSRNCPRYAVVLFSVNSYFIDNNLQFVSKNITDDLFPFLPTSSSDLKVNELRFILEVSLRFKLPKSNFQLPQEHWDWDYMSQYIPEEYQWLNFLDYNQSYILNINAGIQELYPKYKIRDNRGELISARVTNKCNAHKVVSFVGKANVEDITLANINTINTSNLNKSLLNSVIDQSNANMYSSLIENKTVGVPIAYQNILGVSHALA